VVEGMALWRRRTCERGNDHGFHGKGIELLAQLCECHFHGFYPVPLS
jgi:hypothetical protein